MGESTEIVGNRRVHQQNLKASTRVPSGTFGYQLAEGSFLNSVSIHRRFGVTFTTLTPNITVPTFTTVPYG